MVASRLRQTTLFLGVAFSVSDKVSGFSVSLKWSPPPTLTQAAVNADASASTSRAQLTPPNAEKYPSAMRARRSATLEEEEEEEVRPGAEAAAEGVS